MNTTSNFSSFNIMPMWLLKFPVLHVICISMKFSLQFTRGSNEAFNFPCDVLSRNSNKHDYSTDDVQYSH